MAQNAFTDMAEAECAVRDALAGNSPGDGMSALLKLYEQTPEGKRAALVAVLATRAALVTRPRPAEHKS